MTESLVIDPRFCGPPTSGNGGYVCGVLAAHVGGEAEVRLKSPPPLSRSLQIDRSTAGQARLLDGDTVVAEASATRLELDLPPNPGFPAAEQSAKGSIHLEDHNFPTCFVCGPDRAAGDGLRIFAGPVEGRAGEVAAPFVPDASLADANSGKVAPEFVWAALDCPGFFAFGVPTNPVMLGTFSAKVVRCPAIDEQCTVVGWRIGEEGRKRFAGTVLYGDAGDVLAQASAVWIELKPQ